MSQQNIFKFFQPKPYVRPQNQSVVLEIAADQSTEETRESASTSKKSSFPEGDPEPAVESHTSDSAHSDCAPSVHTVANYLSRPTVNADSSNASKSVADNEEISATRKKRKRDTEDGLGLELGSRACAN